MRLCLPVLLLIAIVAGADEPKPEVKEKEFSAEAKKELKKLEGKWALKEGQRRGEKVEIGDNRPVLEINGTKWIFTGQEKGEFIAIFPETDPKCFDLKSVEKGRKGEVQEAIYKIDGDTLTVCIHEGKGKQRPTRFEATAEQPDTILAVFERVKKE
jgi:uncharacterized protein (TIGR03067 family)